MITSQDYQRFYYSPKAFRESLLIEVDGWVKNFVSVRDDWQEEDFAAMDATVLNVCDPRRVLADKDPDQPPSKLINRFYFERPRGHSKTTDIAVTAVYLLTFCNRPLRMYSYAADRDQAALIKDAIVKIIRLNPWLESILTVKRGVIANEAQDHPGNGAQLKIEASDVASSYGILPDVIIADEFTHWQDNASELWESLLSSAAKKSSCMFISIANAGFQETWQWKIREAIKDNPLWYFRTLDGPKASWMTPARLEEQKALLPLVAYKRLWENKWSTGGGDALTEEEINRAFVPHHRPMRGNEAGIEFVAGVDLGLKRDCSAIVVLGVAGHGHFNVGRGGRIYLANHRVWRPQRGKEVNLQEIENTLLEWHATYDLQTVAFDPWQASHISQRLRHQGLNTVDLPQTGKNLERMASRLIEAFTDNRCVLYDCEDLRLDLTKLRVEERSYGYRLISPRDTRGHGDTASAFNLAIIGADELAGEEVARAGVFSSQQELQDAYDFSPYSQQVQETRDAWSYIIREQNNQRSAGGGGNPYLNR